MMSEVASRPNRSALTRLDIFLLFAAFSGVRIAARPARSMRSVARAPTVRVAASSSGYSWLNKEPLALLAGFAG